MEASGLDDEEQALLSAVRKGASEAIGAEAASLTVRWETSEESDRPWPVFCLVPTRGATAPPLFWCLWPEDRERTDMAVGGLVIGNFDCGIVGSLGALDVESLARSVSQGTRAFVTGEANYKAYPADPESYGVPIPEHALAVSVSWPIHTEHGTGEASIRCYLEDPDAFTRLTGISVSDRLEETRSFSGYLV